MSEQSGAADGPKTLAELLGLAQKPIRWTGVASFLLGAWAMAVLGLLLRPDIGDLPPLYLWLGQAIRCILLTGAVALGFRLSRSQPFAAVLSAAFFSLIWWGLSRFLPIAPLYYVPWLPAFADSLCLLLGLVIMLRLFKEPLLGLALGALVGVVGYQLLVTLLHLFGLGFYYASGVSGWAVIRAVVFAVAFWGALRLFEKPAAGPGAGGPDRIGPA